MAADESHCQNCERTVKNHNSQLDAENQQLPLSSLLIIDKDAATEKGKPQTRTKPNICRLPESDIMARMKDFMPLMAENKPVDTEHTDADSVVQFVPISDSDSDQSDSDSEESDDEGAHVEMRLAVVPDMASDSSNESDSDQPQFGEVTEENIRLPNTDKVTGSKPPNIEELD